MWYTLAAEAGTGYAIDLSEKWMWRENSEQADLPDELAARLTTWIVLAICFAHNKKLCTSPPRYVILYIRHNRNIGNP